MSSPALFVRRMPVVVALTMVAVVGLAMQAGCRKSSRPADRGAQDNPERQEAMHN